MRITRNWCVTGLAVLCLAISGYAGAPIDKAKLYDQLNTQNAAGIEFSEYLEMFKGRHTPAVYRALAKRFALQDANGDGKLSEAEFKSPGGNPEALMSAGGELVFPTPGLIVDVDEEYEEFEVLVIPGDDSELEYRYFAKAYTGATPPNPIPSDPTSESGAEEIDGYAGLYLSGWIEELDHQATKDDLVATPKTLVFWEGTREITMCGTGEWTWTSSSLTYYPHTSNLWFTP